MIGNFEPEENVMNRWELKPDVVIDYQDHLKRGHVWRAEIELAMQDTPGDDYQYYRVEGMLLLLHKILHHILYPQCILIMNHSLSMTTQCNQNLSIPDDFPHQPPEGYTYEVKDF